MNEQGKNISTAAKIFGIHAVMFVVATLFSLAITAAIIFVNFEVPGVHDVGYYFTMTRVFIVISQVLAFFIWVNGLIEERGE